MKLILNSSSLSFVKLLQQNSGMAPIILQQSILCKIKKILLDGAASVQ